MSFVLSTFYIAFVQGSYGSWLRERALAPQPFWLNFRAKVVFAKSHVLIRIELPGAIVELARKSKMAWGSLSSEHYVKFFTFMLTSTQS